jgi:hypothetical protein
MRFNTHRNLTTMHRLLLITLLTFSLPGCVSLSVPRLSKTSPEVPVTAATLPMVVKPYPYINKALLCIKKTDALKNKTFIVGPFADSTGKINAVAQSGTGNFIPQGGSASYITDAITKAGGRVISTYFGAPTINAPAEYMVNGIFNSLDFGTSFAADVRVDGVGPLAQFGWAQLTLSIQLDEAGTRLNRQMSMIERPVQFSQMGLGSGRVYGSTLITGNIGVQNQERLQFEALNGPIALGIVDVLFKEFPIAKSECGAMVQDLLKQE